MYSIKQTHIRASRSVWAAQQEEEEEEKNSTQYIFFSFFSFSRLHHHHHNDSHFFFFYCCFIDELWIVQSTNVHILININLACSHFIVMCSRAHSSKRSNQVDYYPITLWKDSSYRIRLLSIYSSTCCLCLV